MVSIIQIWQIFQAKYKFGHIIDKYFEKTKTNFDNFW